MLNSKKLFKRRARRSRFRLKQRSAGLPRLSVFRSARHTYAQVIDDQQGRTVAAVSTLEKDLGGSLENSGNVAAAVKVGQLLAERAGKAGVTKVVFDRSGYKYHGRVKALADAARSAGLKF